MYYILSIPIVILGIFFGIYNDSPKNDSYLVYNDETSKLFTVLPFNKNIKRVVILNDRGGLIRDYIFNLSILENRNIKVEIVGECMSACTIYLGYKNTCVYKDARIYIHSASGDVTPEEIKIANKYLWSRYNDKLKKAILNNGGFTKDFHVYKANKYIKRCNNK